MSISDNGKIIGVCNGDPSCKVLENQKRYPVFNGLMMVFVQSDLSPGTITLKAESEGLDQAEITIVTEAAAMP